MLHWQDLNVWIFLLFFDIFDFLNRSLISIKKSLLSAINGHYKFLDFNYLQIIKNKIYSNLISSWILLIVFNWKETFSFIFCFKCIFLPIRTSWKHADSSYFSRVIMVSVWVVCFFYFFELVWFTFILIIINFEDLHKLRKIDFIINFF